VSFGSENANLFTKFANARKRRRRVVTKNKTS